MKLAMTLTIDGLVRALRGTAHALAEAAEGRYAGEERSAPRPNRTSARTALETGEPDGGRDD
jgi:hypothetical protein